MRLLPLLLSVALAVAVSYIYDPTDEEIEQALDFQKPKRSWGRNARQDNHVRMLCVGGSNTFHRFYTKSLSAYLTNSSAHPGWNGTLEHMAEPGASPDNFIGKKYPFESRPKSTWPNVVLIDVSMNTYGQVPMDNIAESVDALIRTLSYKYIHSNLPVPDYMFLELFYSRHLILFMESNPNATLVDKLAMLNHNTTYFQNDMKLGDFRGCPTCKEIRRVAEFYDYPTVSWRILGYKAFERYFLKENLENGIYQENKWRYTNDGLHISFEGGQLLADTLFASFFTDAMRPRKEQSPNPSEGKLDIHMFAPAVRPLQLVSYVTWDETNNVKLSSIIRQPSGWKEINHGSEVDGFHHGDVCFGTKHQNEPLVVDFDVPKICRDVGDCRVSVGFLHSWNASWIGGLSCDLIQVDGNKMLVMNQHINTTQNGDLVMRHTGAVQTQLKAVVSEGRHTVRCHKLDGKFSCLVTLYTAGTVVL